MLSGGDTKTLIEKNSKRARASSLDRVVHDCSIRFVRFALYSVVMWTCSCSLAIGIFGPRGELRG